MSHLISKLSMIIWVNIIGRLLTVTAVSTMCAVVIYRVMHRLLKCQSLLTTVLFGITFTQTIILNLIMKKEKYSRKKKYTDIEMTRKTGMSRVTGMA